MTIRSIIGTALPYSQICREERNYAAILYAALCDKDNVRALVQKCGVVGHFDQANTDFGIYFEYAYLRDLWNSTLKNNDTKTANDIRKKIIAASFSDIEGIQTLLQNGSIHDINKALVGGSKPSHQYIQSPGHWSVSNLREISEKNDDFFELCRFKWAFNIKPDIVIHLNAHQVICIEAKHESGQSKYPSSAKEKEIFKAAGMEPIGQLALQQYLMTNLLGLDARFVCIESNPSRSRPDRNRPQEDAVCHTLKLH